MPKVRIFFDISQEIEADISEETAEYQRFRQREDYSRLMDDHPLKETAKEELNRILQKIHPNNNPVIQGVLLLEEGSFTCSLCTGKFISLGMSYNYGGSPRGLCSSCLELATSFACSQGCEELNFLRSSPQFRLLSERT